MSRHDPGHARTDAPYYEDGSPSALDPTSVPWADDFDTLDPGRRIGPDSEEGKRIAAELGVEWSPEAKPGGLEEVERHSPQILDRDYKEYNHMLYESARRARGYTPRQEQDDDE